MKNSIIVDGKKRVCVVYDAGDSVYDRYTVIYKAYRARGYGLIYPYLGVSENGSYYHGEHNASIRGPHLGRRVAFENLPEAVQKTIIADLAE